MKTILTAVFALVFTSYTFAQDIAASQRFIYAELLGNALAYSINFEQGFLVRQQNFGVRLGAGYIPSSGASIVMIPIQVNYVWGKKQALEIGMGATLQVRGGNESEIRPSSTLMYRYVSNGGFLFRAGIAPTWLPKNTEPMHIPAELFWFYPGISFGMSL